METVGSCDLCGGQRQKLFEQYAVYDQTFCFVECQDCGLAFLNPRPAPDEIGRYYDDAYDERHAIFRHSTLKSLAFSVLRRLLRMRYQGSAIESAIARHVFFPWELRWREFTRRHHLERIQNIGRVLDVGCGRGYWLGTMRQFGFECHGCETDPKAAKIAQDLGLAVVCTTLKGAEYPNDHFDVVRFQSVLEHVHYPTVNLLEARRVLRSSGLRIIDVPNHVGISAQAFRHSEDVPRHLFSYAPDTLNRYFEKVGLRTISITTRTWYPHSIYGYFGQIALPVMEDGGSPESAAQAKEFWAFANRKRQSEYQPTLEYFDSIGRGCHLIGIATKD